VSRLEKYLDGARAPRVLHRQDGLLPAVEWEPVGNDRCQVEAAGDEVEVVLHGVLRDAADRADAEAVGTDDA
jgi:hypothetical protein